MVPRIARIAHRLLELFVAVRPARVFGRTRKCAFETYGHGLGTLGWADSNEMHPVIAEVVVVDEPRARTKVLREHSVALVVVVIEEEHVINVLHTTDVGMSRVVDVHATQLLREDEGVLMSVRPAEGELHDAVQIAERRVEWNAKAPRWLQRTPNEAGGQGDGRDEALRGTHDMSTLTLYDVFRAMYMQGTSRNGGRGAKRSSQ